MFFWSREKERPIAPYITTAFRTEPRTGAPIVELAVDRLDDLFNRLDRAPFRRRDLSPDFKQFMKECALWVPLPHPIILEIQVPSEVDDEVNEPEVIAGIRNFFGYLVIVQREQAREQRARLGVFVAASLLLLSLVVLLGPVLDPKSVLPSLILSGLTVGGWVFLWEALSAAFIRSADARAELKRNQRWALAEIRFVRIQAKELSV
jgi:hypothetical protein